MFIKKVDLLLYSFIKRHIFFMIIIVFCVVLAVFIFKERSSKTKEIKIDNELTPFLENDAELMAESVDMMIKVDVKGEVNKPGVYEVDDTFRVIDIINTAGGLTTEADESKINLAQKVVDEMVVVVPKIGDEETEEFTFFNGGGDTNQINLNMATVDELSTLNGIGPKKAQVIIDYREENGPFQQVEDIMNVTGIGEKTFDSFKDDVTVK